LAEIRARPRPQPDEGGDDEEEASGEPDDHIDAEQVGGDADAREADKEEGEAGRVWPADQLLEALQRVMLREIGGPETERLFALARADLASGGG
jgi:hypothetical protein